MIVLVSPVEANYPGGWDKFEAWIEANSADAAAERSESERGSNDKP